MRAADDFAAIRARMDELQRERRVTFRKDDDDLIRRAREHAPIEENKPKQVRHFRLA
jgi:hypothetical protein